MAHKLLNAVTTTGVSSSIALNYPTASHTVQVDFVDANASITAMTVVLQACAQNKDTSDADAIWFDLQSYALTGANLTAKSAMFHTVNKPVERVRVNLLTATGIGAGDTVTVRYIQGGCYEN